MQNQTPVTPPLRRSAKADASKGHDQLFRAVFNEASDAMLMLDAGRRIVDANSAACLAFGLNAAELSDRFLDDLLADETGDLSAVWAALLTTGAVKRRHGIAPHGQGRRAVDCSYQILGEADRCLCVIRDTADRQLLEARLAQSEKMDSLGRLAGGIAHDFNNLLTAVLGYTELLLESRGPEADDRGDLEQIQLAGQRAAALTQQLLAYSRKQVLAPREVDLNQTITNLRSMLTRLIREDISVICQPSAQPAFLQIDPAQLEHIIVNLVLNARDAIPAEGTIRIAVTRVPAAEVRIPADTWDPSSLMNPPNSLEVGHLASLGNPSNSGRLSNSGSPSNLLNLPNPVNLSNLANPVNLVNPVGPIRDYIQLRISDDGVGIPTEAHARLFEPFFTTKDAWRRTGLGLASVYGIVRQSHGFIEVESAIGQGTTFLMHFPAVEAAAAAAARPAVLERLAERAADKTILLVEDEDAVRKVVSAMLRRHGYQVIEAATPHIALDLFNQHAAAVDLLLTDIVMPEMNGPGLAQRLVALKPNLRVVFMSGYADVASPFEVDRPNIGFLSKPFQASALISKIQVVLARSKVKS